MKKGTEGKRESFVELRRKRARAELAGRGKRPPTLSSAGTLSEFESFQVFAVHRKLPPARSSSTLFLFVYKSVKGTNCNGKPVTPVASPVPVLRSKIVVTLVIFAGVTKQLVIVEFLI